MLLHLLNFVGRNSTNDIIGIFDSYLVLFCRNFYPSVLPVYCWKTVQKIDVLFGCPNEYWELLRFVWFDRTFDIKPEQHLSENFQGGCILWEEFPHPRTRRHDEFLCFIFIIG